MPFIDNAKELLKKLQTIPAAETAKVAVVRPTTHFTIVTADNPDMKRTLEAQEKFINDALQTIKPYPTGSQLDQTILDLKSEFQNQLSKTAENQQNGLLLAMKEHGIHVRTTLEDKGELETAQFDYYTDQIFATDTGQYYDKDGKLFFIPASFKNQQRLGEERLATHQAKNLGAVVEPLVTKTGKQLTFEGGDIRQMPGKKLFFIGQGHRSDAETSKLIAKLTDYFVLPIKLLNEQFYHLDCCFLPLPNNAAVIYEGEYQLNEKNEKILDEKTGWPMLIAGSETMTPESRALIRTIYTPDQLILITVKEALAFATNAALLQSASDDRFKLFVNGDRNNQEDENTAIAAHQISFTAQHIKEIITATKGAMDIIEIPYSTMHGSGGSVRCTVQEVACTKKAIEPHKNNKYYFGDAVNRLEDELSQKPIRNKEYYFGDAIDKLETELNQKLIRSRNQFFGNPQTVLPTKTDESTSAIDCKI